MSTASATRAHCVGFVHVGQHRQAELGSDFGEDRQRRIEADAARAFRAGAVGLVEGGLVDEPDAEPRRRSPSSADAISSACARLSSWHGPAINASGKALPKRAEPTLTIGFGINRLSTGLAFRGRPCPRKVQNQRRVRTSGTQARIRASRHRSGPAQRRSVHLSAVELDPSRSRAPTQHSKGRRMQAEVPRAAPHPTYRQLQYRNVLECHRRHDLDFAARRRDRNPLRVRVRFALAGKSGHEV